MHGCGVVPCSLGILVAATFLKRNDAFFPGSQFWPSAAHEHLPGVMGCGWSRSGPGGRSWCVSRLRKPHHAPETALHSTRSHPRALRPSCSVSFLYSPSLVPGWCEEWHNVLFRSEYSVDIRSILRLCANRLLPKGGVSARGG